jgi:hypothetical protein
MSAYTGCIKSYITAILLLISFLAGCSGVKTYPDTLAKNMNIQTKTDSSFISTVRATVSIYRVDADCQLEYQGTVKLDKRSVAVGIPSGRSSYLVFGFASSSFLFNARSTISYETLLRPVAGHIYDVNVSYVDDIYNVEILETDPMTSATRHVAPEPLNTCRNV